MIRFSSLGDVMLAASVTGALGEVVFRTMPRYFDLVRRFPGVVEAIGPDEAARPGRVIDLHHNLRSLRYAADRRVARWDWRRNARVWFKTKPAPSVLSRYAEAAGVTMLAPPWLPPAVRGSALIIAPGAAHATKRWPHYRALAAAWPGEVRVVGGPGDEAQVEPLGGRCETGFEHTLAAMEGAAVCVAGDTGLMHLAVAAGLPTVAIFGPTTSEDGFFAYPAALAAAVELPLSCRPCSRFGGNVCPMGDHACMQDISAQMVLSRALALAQMT